jgi:glycosyltransferase involved in cell wall biosynthesis
MEGVSVIICCYNSAIRLPATLRCLAKQTNTDDFKWEVVLVDNASVDSTAEVAHHEWKKYNLNVPLRIINETKQGQSYARAQGIAESIYSTIIFCDDDNWLEEDFLSNAKSLMHSSERVGAIGGLGKPIFETSPPKWFSLFHRFYAIGEQNNTQLINGRELNFVYGAGIVVNRAVLEKLKDQKFTPLTSGRAANNLISGDDTELCYAFQIVGYRILYSEKLKFGHFMPKARLTISYALKLVFSIGYSSEYLFPYKVWLNSESRFPYPNVGSGLSASIDLAKSMVVLLFPLAKYGPFIERLRNLAFVAGRAKFHFQNQSFFREFNQFLKYR